jgi:16S rRNA (guanine(966)-N(2))-methyltransferase RsmD
MRVIAGEARGKKLYAVPGKTTRSITSRVKKSLFDILVDDIPGCRFLDLFAGAGSVGIEALSRGADACVFVERNSRAIATIRRNLQTTGLGARARVVSGDVFHYIRQQLATAFDIIYVAPPQYRGLWAETLLALDCSPILRNNGIAVAQIFPKEYHPLELGSLEMYDQRRYGSTLLCFYTCAAPQHLTSDQLKAEARID